VKERIARRGIAPQDRNVEIATSGLDAPPRNDSLFRDQKKLDAAVEVAIWWRSVRARTVPTFLPLLFDEHRHLVLKGGGGSGKSIFAGQKIIERCVSEPGHRFLVVRKVAKSLRQSCFRQLAEQAREYYPDEVDKIPQGQSGDMYITFKNGSEILFSGLDDVEKLKSIRRITGVWIEEATEVLENDFDQLDIRLRDKSNYYQQIIVTFNPISITHWLKKRFFDRKDEDVRVHESTYLDNPYLPEANRKVLEKFKDTNPYFYTVYCLGMWGVIGRTFFNAKQLQSQLQKKIKPAKIGNFRFDYDGLQITNIRFEEDKDGIVKIYRLPQPGRPYVIGGDTAGEGSDSFVGQCIDNITGVQCATLKNSYEHGMDEGTYAHQMYCLGMWYNEALMAIETNFSTHPQKELERLGYRKFFVREREDTYTGAIAQSYGFRTDKLTRPVILGNLQGIVREHVELIQDEETLNEMLTFTLNEERQLRPEAEAGSHDDCVMAIAIAFIARSQQRMTVESGTDYGTEGWTKDMWEDYNRASPAEKKMLLEHWGSVKV